MINLAMSKELEKWRWARAASKDDLDRLMSLISLGASPESAKQVFRLFAQSTLPGYEGYTLSYSDLITSCNDKFIGDDAKKLQVLTWILQEAIKSMAEDSYVGSKNGYDYYINMRLQNDVIQSLLTAGANPIKDTEEDALKLYILSSKRLRYGVTDSPSIDIVCDMIKKGCDPKAAYNGVFGLTFTKKEEYVQLCQTISDTKEFLQKDWDEVISNNNLKDNQKNWLTDAVLYILQTEKLKHTGPGLGFFERLKSIKKTDSSEPIYRLAAKTSQSKERLVEYWKNQYNTNYQNKDELIKLHEELKCALGMGTDGGEDSLRKFFMTRRGFFTPNNQSGTLKSVSILYIVVENQLSLLNSA